MKQSSTLMLRETLDIPSAAERLLTHGNDAIRDAAAALRTQDPAFMPSVARGSSDHVATYFKYVSELLLGVPVASVGPSVASVYQRQLKLSGSACISISQSGKSPDIVAMARAARSSGALSIAMTNNGDSELAQVSDHVLNLHAGPEISVAATKTFVNSAISSVWLLAEFTQDRPLLAAIRNLPEVLEKSVQQDWSGFGEAIKGRQSLYCLGRGPSWAMANEAALKFKEICQLHAESYSSAEVLHGPVSLVDGGFPVLAMTAEDPAEAVLVEVADAISALDGAVFVTSSRAQKASCLPVVRTGHFLTDPIAVIAGVYVMVEKIARAHGIDPDAPRHLKKITETV